MDRYYTHEARAYDVLSELQRKQIPIFYGAYTLDIPVNSSEARTVRLILIEYIPGVSMQQVNPKDFSQHDRQEIMKSVIDFESLVYERDILLQDLSPRNVMMAEKSYADPERSLVFIDFDSALFNRGKYEREPIIDNKNLLLGQWISPLLRWKNRSMALQFTLWIDWDLQRWVEAEYAHTASTITPEMRESYCRRTNTASS
ncbi:hypothetical protein AJ79_05082 [Helicocarpus griseus UAMH5409]|uniref:Protein kinase domain-containing protein n=1 Tax=Helicocarpus griseus UAMH5409 TaxID=1447875 RepID=A0A2B7XQ02_9EURO|nr:hypothetical protein AJ79_05082 [Helicocarpus griseus UAMH5409]